MRQIATIVAVLIYLAVVARSWVYIGQVVAPPNGSLSVVLARGFLLAESLFCLPLPIRSIFTLSIEGAISPQIGLFAGYIPAAVLYCAAFNVTFAVAFRSMQERVRPANARARVNLGTIEWTVIAGFFVASLWMLGKLAQDVGGILGLVLLGYRVTETFIGNTHYAVAFDWLASIVVLGMAAALIARVRWAILGAAIPMVMLVGAFLVMGRRGAIVNLGLAVLFTYHVAYRPLTRPMLAGLVIAGFMAMNAVGLLRGSDYEDLGSALQRTQEISESIRSTGETSAYYHVFATGQFAVPFETLPQVIRTFGETYTPGLGFYSLQSMALIVPAALWPSRPVPLGNWYMQRFYGVTELNIGRQFFFLTDAYMNFGPIGFLIWGIALAWLWSWIGGVAATGRGDPVIVAGTALFAGSMLTIVSSDIPAFLVAFAKGPAFPVLVLLLIRRARLGQPSPGST